MKFRLNISNALACAAILVLPQMTPTISLAQTQPGATSKINPPPPLPVPKAPIDFFRELLALSTEEREKILAEKTPEQRKVLLAKLKEYESMDPGQRELRLKVTELRWYLAPLMKLAPDKRGDWLAIIPEETRPLVDERLRQWDELSPAQKEEFWDNEMAINYFLRLQSSTPEQQNSLLENVSPAIREKLEKDFARWRSLPTEDRDRMCNRFQQFFNLNSAEKEKTLGMLSESERMQMEQTLKTFQNLAPEQRKHCIESFRKFARMDPAERNRFLQKAQMWKKMSPDDRQAWRELVQKLPQMPPLPPGLKITPPLPPALQSNRATSNTNPPR